ncbi:MAG: arylsulfotransferase family protein [Pseudomonadota bacterium]
MENNSMRKYLYIIFFMFLAFSTGVLFSILRLPPYGLVRGGVEQVQLVRRDAPSLLGLRPVHWTTKRRYEGQGVKIHRAAEAGSDYVLLQGFFEGGLEIRLVELDGTVVHRWPISPGALTEGIEHLSNRPLIDWNYDSHGAVALPDGSVVFNIDHIALVKLDRCGAVVWRVDTPAHHSIERNADGTFWVSSAVKHRDASALADRLYRPPFAEDHLTKIGPDGRILANISLIEVFRSNDAMGLLTLPGGTNTRTYRASRPDMPRELFHLNDVEALPADMAGAFDAFASGDLLVSLRNRNLILVMDPNTLRMKWWHIGNWVRHHDPDWHADGTIRLFDNNRDGTEAGDILGSSRIVSIEPDSKRERILLGEGEDPVFHTTRRGKHQQLSGGRILVTEAEAGRVFITNSANEIVWEYLNVFDETHAARISEARAYPREYFDVSDWSCGK